MTTLITHSGKFHLDDVASAVMLYHVTHAERLIRTRSVEEHLTEDSYVFDVGMVYNHEARRYDHHQTSFNVSSMRNDTSIPFSSCGLIYLHYGMDYLNFVFHKAGMDTSYFEKVYNTFHHDFVQIADANDNGIRLNPLNTTDIISFVSGLNNEWVGIPSSRYDHLVVGDNPQDFRFAKAMDILATFMEGMIYNIYNRVKAASDVRDNHILHDNGTIMELKVKTAWHETVIEHYPDVQFVISPSDKDGVTVYNVDTVPIENFSFQHRQSLHADFVGKTSQQVFNELHIPDFIFTHKARFCGAASTLHGAIAMARYSLK